MFVGGKLRFMQLLAAGRWGPLGADEVQGLLSGRYYVNVHTPINTAGELRGNVIPLLKSNTWESVR